MLRTHVITIIDALGPLSVRLTGEFNVRKRVICYILRNIII